MHDMNFPIIFIFCQLKDKLRPDEVKNNNFYQQQYIVLVYFYSFHRKLFYQKLSTI